MRRRETSDVDSQKNLPPEIARLYTVFARYPARPGMPYCEHCRTAEEIRHLTSTPLMELQESQLYSYTWHAISTAGEAVDFKHFLPRVFHKMLYEGSDIDAEVVTGKLNEGRWRDWPLEEQEAVRLFLWAWWKHLLAVFPANHDADSCLCAIAMVTDDLAPFLDAWQATREAPAARHLAALITARYADLMKGTGTFSFGWWEERPRQAEQVRQWILDPAINTMLEEAFAQYADEVFAKDLSDAVQQLEWVHEAMNKREAT